MADFVRKRLQVFVSSTFLDLIPERQAAVEAILTAGHIPAGMELFTSGDESQMDAIKQWIDESDVYLLILGGRYGSIEPNSGKSYTELEYEYAVEKEKPLFVCVVNDEAQNARVKEHGVDFSENEEPKKLKAFRDVATSKLVKFWDDKKDIKITVGETLANFARREELIGWIRPTDHGDMATLAHEIARLSEENSRLRSHLGTSRGELLNGLTYHETWELLRAEDVLEFFVSNSQEWAEGYVAEDVEDEESATKLQMVGLLDYSGGTYKLNPQGRVFLNRHRLETLEGEDRI